MNVFTTEPYAKVEIDADKISPGLYQGSIPPQGRALFEARFSYLVLAADEFQPKAERFPGVRVLHAPTFDGSLDSDRIRTFFEAADRVTEIVRGGGRVLVTCIEGRNRSGMIVALALRNLYGMNGASAMMHVKQNRKHADALTNQYFQAFLMSLPRPGQNNGQNQSQRPRTP